jgi:hypothetical protein
MYRFKSGMFKGKTVEQAMLRNAPALYRIASWAKRHLDTKPYLRPSVKKFHRMELLLARAEIRKRCYEPECNKRAQWITADEGLSGRQVYEFWCDRHEPLEDDSISSKVPINFELMSAFRTAKEKRAFCRAVLRAYGVKKGTKITEGFAHNFFKSL